VCEVDADILLTGDLDASYHSSDNSSIIPTDTVKNTVHALAHDSLATCRTQFAKALGQHFLDRYSHLDGASVELRERRWQRMPMPDGPHRHSFVAEEKCVWFTRCSFQRGEKDVLRAGLRDHLIMKTTESGFEGYNQCELTTLSPTPDRILSTKLSAEWVFAEGTTDFSATDSVFVNSAYEVFAQRYSPSVQRTLFEIGEHFLEAAPNIVSVELKMPNVHFLNLDLSKLGLPNQSKVFLPTDEPHGEIEALVTREP
jgi:urate oxidase